jgi:hypothetical protein
MSIKGAGMSKVVEQHVVDTSSAEFREGLEAGLNSTADTINWQAGNELGQELKDGSQKKEPVRESLPKEPPTPLFMSDSSEGDQGNAQDEKDKTEE